MLRPLLVLTALLALGCAAFKDQPEETAGFEPEDTVYQPCTPYCQRMMANCNPGTLAIYPDSDDCYEACIEWPRDGTEGDESGPTLQCHETWANQTPLDPDLYCPKAGPDSEDCM